MKMYRGDVEAYLHWHAVAAQAKQELDKLRPTLLSSLKEGLSSPIDLPFLLELRTSTRTEKDYKTPLLAALKRLLGTKEKAEKRIEAIEQGFERKDVDSIHVVQNKEYAKQVFA